MGCRHEINCEVIEDTPLNANIDNVVAGGTKDHDKLINRDKQNQHPISAIEGLEEALRNSGKVKDVKSNGVSVVDSDGNANIPYEYVKYTANQNLTAQQKLNARNNIEALGSDNIMQGEGESTEDVISQKGVTDLLADKQEKKPNGIDDLVSSDTGKLNLVYIPSTVLGGITNGGTFDGQGIITASSYAPELQGEKIDEVEFGSYPSYYFICSAPYSFAGFSFDVGDWAISLGNGWAKLNATDAVTSVNGKMGQVVLNYNDVGAAKNSWGIDNANKNLVTDAQGNVVTSDYALGQIIVEYYNELPTNVPETAKASVIKSSSVPTPVDYSKLDEYEEQQTIFENISFVNEPALFDNEDSISISDENGESSYSIVNGMYYSETKNVFSIGNDYTGELWIYNDIEQNFSDGVTPLNIGWNNVTYNEETGEPIIIPITHEDLPVLENMMFYGYSLPDEQDFLNNVLIPEIKLAGEYIYTEIQPSTTPKTYYWKYTPTNVQSDWDEEDPLSLAYIKNKPTFETPQLNTTNTQSLTPDVEDIENTINLHKISKTGNNDDLVNFVGRRNKNSASVIGGEIFNSYTGLIDSNRAPGEYSHAEGFSTKATNDYAHAEGYSTTASANSSHAEGKYTTASGDGAHAECSGTTASGFNSHAEGSNCVASGNTSHAEGYYCDSIGDYSHVEGYATKASSNIQHVEGKHNIEDSNSRYQSIVGNGADNNNRSNMFTRDWNGNIWVKGNVYVGGTSQDDATQLTPGGGTGSKPKKKTFGTYTTTTVTGGIQINITDSDVTTSTNVELYPTDITTEQWLQENLVSSIINEISGGFNFTVKTSLPNTFNAYYIITEVQNGNN